MAHFTDNPEPEVNPGHPFLIPFIFGLFIAFLWFADAKLLHSGDVLIEQGADAVIEALD